MPGLPEPGVRIVSLPTVLLSPPAAPSPAGALAAGLRTASVDPAVVLQAAAVAAATPWTALDHLAADRAPMSVPSSPIAPPAVPPQSPVAPAAAAAAAALLAPSLSATASATGAVPVVPGAAGLAVGWSAGWGAARPAADRLTLSPATVALPPDPFAAGRPAAALMLDLLGGLTGEPASRLHLLAAGGPDLAAAAAAAMPAARGPGEWLQVLVRGIVHGLDERQVDVTLGLSLQRQTGPVPVDAARLELIRATLEQLAQATIDLDYPGSAAALAGHSLRFQAVLDPAGLWPMQSFLLSGLLLLGPAREAAAPTDAPDVAEACDADEGSDHQASEDDEAAEPEDPARDEGALAAPAASELPADGGPPLISARQWLDLELRHWRRQLRSWMQLPLAPPLGSMAQRGR
ncbi:hypothetical protein [Nevskia sp.]|uniref:hypothetical protein n=1 Tax=Nevskia sp. TaxID=1929292 RepID=UPI003F6E747C